MPYSVTQESRVYGGEQQRSKRQSAAEKDQEQAEQLVRDIAAVLAHAPCPVQRDFQRFENSVRGEQQQ